MRAAGIGVGPQVAARDAALDEPLDLGVAHRHDAVAERLRELGIGREIGDEALHDAAHQRRSEHLTAAFTNASSSARVSPSSGSITTCSTMSSTTASASSSLSRQRR